MNMYANKRLKPRKRNNRPHAGKVAAMFKTAERDVPLLKTRNRWTRMEASTGSIYMLCLRGVIEVRGKVVPAGVWKDDDGHYWMSVGFDSQIIQCPDDTAIRALIADCRINGPFFRIGAEFPPHIILTDRMEWVADIIVRLGANPLGMWVSMFDENSSVLEVEIGHEHDAKFRDFVATGPSLPIEMAMTQLAKDLEASLVRTGVASPTATSLNENTTGFGRDQNHHDHRHVRVGKQAGGLHLQD